MVVPIRDTFFTIFEFCTFGHYGIVKPSFVTRSNGSLDVIDVAT